ncbi:hypothetical protein [Thioalkalivibrio sp. ALE12]|nr:hypothetical protein [Thioalkalivibrio sp. ALE12]
MTDLTAIETAFWLTVVYSGLCFGFGVLALISDTIEALIRRVQS